MPSLKVLQPAPGLRPSINDDCAKVVDQESNKLFVYGGVRWRRNADYNSPTTLPTADFYVCDLVCLEWVRYSVSKVRMSFFATRLNLPKDIVRNPYPYNPFKIGPVDPKLNRLPEKRTSLPLLQDPVGTILRDRQKRITYLLILGDIVETFSKDDDNPKAPLLLCINLTLGKWLEIPLKKAKRVEGGRCRASMVVTGDIGSPDLKLLVFGGVNNVSYH